MFSVCALLLTVLSGSLNVFVTEGVTRQRRTYYNYGEETVRPKYDATVEDTASDFDKSAFKDTKINPTEISKNKSYAHVAAALKRNIRKKIKPCDNFYKHSCGLYLKTKTLPEDKTQISVFTKVADYLQDQLRALVKDLPAPRVPKAYWHGKILFSSCMERRKIDERGVQHVLDFMPKFGGWPLFEGDKWNEKFFDVSDTIVEFARYGFPVNTLFTLGVGTDFKDSTKRMIHADQPSLGLSREYLIKGMGDPLVTAYYEYMIDICTIFGADRDKAVKDMWQALHFEIQLANVSLPIEERRDFNKMHNPFDLTRLNVYYGFICWKDLLDMLIPREAPYKVTEMIINLDVPTFFLGLEKVLREAPKRVVANYLMWRAAASTVSMLTEELRARQQIFNGNVTGRTKREPRWKECLQLVTTGLHLAVSSQYVRKHFNESARNDILDMTQRIHLELKKILSTVDWMDEETRKHALEKADAVANHIAYPVELLDVKKVTQYYERLEIHGDLFFEAVLNLTKFHLYKMWIELNEPVNKTDWRNHGNAIVVNAFYNPIENSMQFPAGILQGGFYTQGGPRYSNYAAIGFIIAHEMTHGFDDMGRQFDKDGKLVNWWKPETKKKFDEKKQCIIDQYGNYFSKEAEMKLNGINTQGENIADIGGAKIAYRAYQSWVKDNGPEKRPEYMSVFNPNQLFWLSFANVWCTVYRPEALKLQMITGYHPPAEFRVNGACRNIEEFSNDFGCEDYRYMNLGDKS